MPRCSMYVIFTYIYPKHCPNVGKYSIHGASGILRYIIDGFWFWIPRHFPQEGLLFQRLGEWQERLRRCQQMEEAGRIAGGVTWPSQGRIPNNHGVIIGFYCFLTHPFIDDYSMITIWLSYSFYCNNHTVK